MPAPTRPTWGSPFARHRDRLGLGLTLALALGACAPGALTGVGATGPKATEPNPDTEHAVALGATTESHTKEGQPNVAMAFPQQEVREFRVDIAQADWDAMQADMTKLYGVRGQGGMGGPGGVRPEVGASGALRPRPDRAASGGMLPPGFDPGAAGGMFPPPGFDPMASGGAFPMPGMEPGASAPGGFRGGPLGTGENPMWVQGTVRYQGKAWPHVGVRFKGNSSLASGWRGSSNRLPLKLDFDQWEERFPEVKDQRFWGHKQLALSTNFSDPTAMREGLSYALFEQLGLPAAKTGFYRVVLNHGGVVEDLGIYTAVEVIDDTGVKRVFGKDKGNVYEGDGQAVSLAAGTRDRLRDSYLKENNKDSDWGDLEALYDALHDPQRQSNPAAWRQALEAKFEVKDFLKWLAVAAALQHWDTYGQMAHNFYLYHHHETGKLNWISWDHNLVLGAGPGAAPAGAAPGGAMPQPGVGLPGGEAAASAGARPAGMGRGVSFERSEATAAWPLIRFLLDDPSYKAAYQGHLKAIAQQGFTEAELLAKVAAYDAVLSAEMAKGADGSGYTAGLQALRQAIASRVAALKAHVATLP